MCSLQYSARYGIKVFTDLTSQPRMYYPYYTASFGTVQLRGTVRLSMLQIYGLHCILVLQPPSLTGHGRRLSNSLGSLHFNAHHRFMSNFHPWAVFVKGKTL